MSWEVLAILPPSEKVNLACIGVGNRGWTVIRQMEAHNIVAICDVDANYLGKASERYPNARKYNDFRKLMDWEENNIDAVVVCSPDHTHAPASMAALRAGKHVYCEKPLTHSIYEARTMAKAARESRPGHADGQRSPFRTQLSPRGRVDPLRGHRTSQRSPHLA